MSDALLVVLLLLSAAGATVTVAVRRPRPQAMALSVYGLVLTLLFVSLQAPDVALSEAVVGGIALPAMVLLAVSRIEESGRGRR
jgi:uncharacterized MnhB-related membrane protein